MNYSLKNSIMVLVMMGALSAYCENPSPENLSKDDEKQAKVIEFENVIIFAVKTGISLSKKVINKIVPEEKYSSLNLEKILILTKEFGKENSKKLYDSLALRAERTAMLLYEKYKKRTDEKNNEEPNNNKKECYHFLMSHLLESKRR